MTLPELQQMVATLAERQQCKLFTDFMFTPKQLNQLVELAYTVGMQEGAKSADKVNVLIAN